MALYFLWKEVNTLNEKLISGAAYTVCPGCRCPFPKTWIRTGVAYKKDGAYYCGIGCFNKNGVKTSSNGYMELDGRKFHPDQSISQARLT